MTIIAPPKWWRRREARAIQAAIKRSRRARFHTEAMLAAEQRAFQARQPELRKTPKPPSP